MIKTSITLFILSLICLTPLSALKSPGISVLSKGKESKVAYVGAEAKDDTAHISKVHVKKK